jgi:hypothetical protein
MNYRIILISIILYSTIFSLYHCTRYGVVGVSNQLRVHPDGLQISPKLGVAVLFSTPKNTLATYEGLLETVKTAQENLKASSWSKRNHLEWIRTSLDSTGYDYSQDYREGEKKNLIEIQVRSQHLGDPKISFLFLMTLGIFPSSVDYKVDVSGVFYDSSGERQNLNTKNSLTIRATKSLPFALPFLGKGDANASIQGLFQKQIIESYKEMKERDLSHNEFENSTEPLDIPVRMKINYFACDSSYSKSYGTAIQDTFIFDSEKYLLCHTQVNFRTHTMKTISLHTKDFYLITKNQKIPSIQKITADYTARDTDGQGVFNRRGVTRDLSRCLTLKPDDSEFASFLEIRFLIPEEEVHSIDSIRWEDKEQSANAVDVWIGWGEGDDPQK